MQGLPIPSICGTIAAACVRQRNRVGSLLAVFVSLWRRASLGGAAGAPPRGSASRENARGTNPSPRAEFKRHGLDVGAGQDEMVADARRRVRTVTWVTTQCWQHHQVGKVGYEVEKKKGMAAG